VLRRLGATRVLPGYLCSDQTCNAIHNIHLETAHSAISRANDLLASYIEDKVSRKPDEFARVAADIMAEEFAKADIDGISNLFDAISDGLDLNEFRSFVDRLLRSSFKRSEARSELSVQIGAVVSNPTEFVANSDRAELMQIVLLQSNEQIIDAIDASVSTKSIDLRDFEVRTSRVKRWDRQNRGPNAEIGRYGVRFVMPPTAGLVTIKLLRLLHELYYMSGDLDPADLSYALDSSPELGEEELLCEAVRRFPPEELLRRLVISNRRAAERAALRFQIYEWEKLPREQLLERLIWKLGVPETVSFADLDRVAIHENELRHANSAGESEEVVRSHISNLFAAIEDALQRGLIFTTWCMTEDHYLASDPFMYDPGLGVEAMRFIDDKAPVDDPELRLTVGKNTLVPLASGYARLAKALRRTSEEDHKRSEDQHPPICKVTKRPFAFPYTLPFHNLSASARGVVLRELQTLARTMQEATVVKVRNSIIHGNNEFPTRDEIASAVQHVATWRGLMESKGFYPRLYALMESSRDVLGREVLRYQHREQEVKLFRPGWAVAPRMPISLPRMIIVPVAMTVSSGPLRFRLKGRPGKDPYWDGYPRRWKVRNDYSAKDRPEVQQDGVVSGSA
jgi:hypothetical protein